MGYYGMPPLIVGSVRLVPQEMCFVQYLPILIPGSGMAIPTNLLWTLPLINKVVDPLALGLGDHVYLTVKHLYVTPSNMGNRPGWHTDGFGSEDVSYVWCNKFPTEFCIQEFLLSDDHDKSLIEMESQVTDKSVIITYPENTILRLDKYNVHRVPKHGEGYRTFVKVNTSKDRYNLIGNAHNYLLDYNWNMVERNPSRNHTSKQ